MEASTVPSEVAGRPGSVSSLMEAAACLKWKDRGEESSGDLKRPVACALLQQNA